MKDKHDVFRITWLRLETSILRGLRLHPPLARCAAMYPKSRKTGMLVFISVPEKQIGNRSILARSRKHVGILATDF